MHIETVNTRGVRAPTRIALDRITALCGPVGAGKSSLMMTTAACLMGRPVPGSAKPAKADMAAFLSHGAQEAQAVLAADTGSTTLRWPTGTVLAKGRQTPTASESACGLISVLEMRAADRADALARALKTAPTAEELTQELAAAGLDTTTIEAVVTDVSRGGWDGAHQSWIAVGREAKRAWEKIASGHNYGSKIAAEWRPVGWEPDLSGRRLSDLEQDVAAAKAAFDQAQRTVNANEARLAELSGQISQMDGARRSVQEATSGLDAAMREVESARQRLDETPRPVTGGHPCPHCGHVLTGAGPYQEASMMGPEERMAIESRHDAAKKALATADTAAREATARERSARDRLQVLERGKTEFEETMRARRAPVAGDALDESAIRAEVDRAELRLKAWSAKHAADAEHGKILDASAIVKLLSPDGVRKRKLTQTLEVFNDRLSALCEDAGIGKVQITDGLGATFDGRQYNDLSTGEAFLCRATVQVSIALLDGSEAVLIDVDRPLDATSINGVIGLLDVVTTSDSSPISFGLLALTLTRPAQAPDLSLIEDNSCVSYWVEGGVVKLLAEVK